MRRHGFTLIELLVVIPLVPRRKPARRGFTLIELLVVIAIVAVLAVVVVIVLNPASLLQQARDSNRLSDLATINAALGYLRTDQPSATLGSASTSYISVPDPSATSTSGDQCQGLGLPSLGSSSWQCAPASTSRRTDTTGWIPVSLGSISYGTPLGQLPVDPTNQTSSNLFYAYQTNGSQYEVTAMMESSKYRSQLSASPQIANYPGVAAQGTSLTLGPLWNANALLGYWSFEEGTGSTTIDQAGGGNGGSWSGTPTAGSYYTTGKVGRYAALFNGTDDYIQLNNVAAENTLPITVSAWVKPVIKGFSYSWNIFNKYPNGSVNGYQFAFTEVANSGDIVLAPYWYRASGNDLVGSSDQFALGGQWIHLAVVYSLSSMKLYVDGVLNKTIAWVGTAGSVTQSTAPRLGLTLDGTGFANGSLDDVRLYTSALSDAEIMALYNAER